MAPLFIPAEISVVIDPLAVILVTLFHVPATVTVKPAPGPVVAALVCASPSASVPTTVKVIPVLLALEVKVTC